MMNQQKRFLVGVLSGSVSGLILAILVLLATWLVWGSANETREILATGWAMFLVGPMSGAIVGAMHAGLDRVFKPADLRVLSFLVCVALASAAVVLSEPGGRNVLPLAAYGLAVLDGTILLPVVRVISRHAFRQLNRYDSRPS
jgi:hypothetical protein